ncbi:hypothetical protein GCM10020331_018270 [Ectobacillus funiculus]
MAKKKQKFVCQECGYQSPKYMGKCPGCSSWNTMVEEIEETISSRRLTFATGAQTEFSQPRPITQVETKLESRIETRFSRV